MFTYFSPGEVTFSGGYSLGLSFIDFLRLAKD